MAFNRDAFIKEAIARGASREEIQRVLSRKKSGFQKFVESPALPAGGGVLGGLIGSAVGPAGTVGGATAGAFGGSALQNLLKTAGGYQNQQPMEQLKGAGKNAQGAFELSGLAALLPYLGVKKISELRADKLANVPESLREIPYSSVATNMKNISIPGVPPQQVQDIVKGETERLFAGPAGEIPASGYLNMERQPADISNVQKWISEVNRLYGKKAYFLPGNQPSPTAHIMGKIQQILQPEVASRAKMGGQGIDALNKIIHAYLTIGNLARTAGKVGLYGGLGAGAAYMTGKGLSAVSPK